MLFKFCEILFCGDYTSTLARKPHLVKCTFLKHKHCCGEVCNAVLYEGPKKVKRKYADAAQWQKNLKKAPKFGRRIHFIQTNATNKKAYYGRFFVHGSWDSKIASLADSVKAISMKQ